MPDGTVWDAMPIHLIISFFGFFTLTSLFSAWTDSFYGKKIFKIVVGLNIAISVFFWIAIMIHSIGEIQQMDSFYHIHNISFVLFSYAWSLALCPVVLFWLELRRI